MKRLWLIVALLLAAAAAVFMWRGNFDSAFVAAVLGCVAWFLNYRTHAKATITAADAEEEKLRNEFSEGVREYEDSE